jgi:hypothetical protein
VPTTQLSEPPIRTPFDGPGATGISWAWIKWIQDLYSWVTNLLFSNIGGSLNVSQINATGTPGPTTALFGGNGTQGAWQVPAGGGGGGTVTSVALDGDGVVFDASVPGSPITTAGTLKPALAKYYQGNFLKTPTPGGPAVMSPWEAGPIGNLDLPADVVTSITDDTNVTGSIAAQDLTLGWTGQLGLARGGTDADLSATGGANEVLQQTTSGGAVTVGQLGNPSLKSYTKVDLTAQTNSIGSTTLFAVGASGAGTYRVSISAVTTTAGTSGDTLTVTIGWVNESGAATFTTATLDLSTLSAELDVTQILSSAASQNITYSTTVSAILGNPQYSLHLRLEYLG